MMQYYILIPLLPLAAFIINGVFGKRFFEHKSHYVSIAAVAISFILSVKTLFDVKNGAVINMHVYTWISSGNFNVSIGMLIDGLTATMLIVVTTVSLLVHIYSVGYMHGDEGYNRYYAYLPLFTFSMLMLVMANNFLQLYVFWEAVGLCSYFLIGHWYYKKSASDAAKKAFVVNRIGDFGFGLGIIVVFFVFGSLDYSYIFANAQKHLGETIALSLFGKEIIISVIALMALLLFTGAMGKSAQIPLHVWLPDAMEGPTPVSALIHAATMVTAGVYMVARLNPIFSLSPMAMEVVAVIGALTAIFAATIALTQNDIKRVLAYSTVSQLGYMFLACGVGAYAAGIFHLTTHAFFKALLFLGSGSVIHAMAGEHDMRKMGGLYPHMKTTAITFWIASLAIAGIPPLAGFWSKDEILHEVFKGGHTMLYVIGISTALLTAFYMFRLIFMTFHGKSRVDKHVAEHLHESPAVMTYPLIILAVLSIIAGFIGYPPEHGFIHKLLGPAVGEVVSHIPDSKIDEVAFNAMNPVGLAPKVHIDEKILIGIAISVATAGILLSWLMYLIRTG
ncbi:MAG: NADH-quinone oxidoreductase subunit L, partial [Nitrospirae bacterium]|nr:NADH-quinone oxidoreductase subunit L [Nitrospirota bacterium]